MTPNMCVKYEYDLMPAIYFILFILYMTLADIYLL